MNQRILLVTDGIFHPPLIGRIILHRTLKQLQDFSFSHVRSLEKLPADLDSFTALVLHYHHNEISPPALTKLDGFVKNGGGVLAIHAATASFKETLPYFKILGGRFIGHGAVEPFLVRNSSQGRIFEGIPDFTVTDELYLHELEPGIEAHFMSQHAGSQVPVVWTYQYGAGMICYACPGHTTGSMKNPAYQEVLRRGLSYVTGGWKAE